MESHLSLFPIHIRINIIILHTGDLSISGTGQRVVVEGKSFRYDELDPDFFLKEVPGVLIPYLDTMQIDLDMRK